MTDPAVRAAFEKALAKKPEPPGVMIGHCSDGKVETYFHDCVAQFLLHDAAHEGYVVQRGGFLSVVSGPRIATARNTIVSTFLDHPNRPEWLWMVDTDMVFGADYLRRLLQVADRKKAPIVGGLCFGGTRETRLFPTLYRLVRHEEGGISMEGIADYPEGLVKVDATGAAFMLIHRSVLEAVGEKWAGTYPWFVEGGIDAHGQEYGEDIAFCLRAGSLGFPIHVDTRIKVGHVKPTIIDESAYREWQAERDELGAEGQQRKGHQRLRLIPDERAS